MSISPDSEGALPPGDPQQGDCVGLGLGGQGQGRGEDLQVQARVEQGEVRHLQLLGQGVGQLQGHLYSTVRYSTVQYGTVRYGRQCPQ